MTPARALARLEVSADTWDEVAVRLAASGRRHLVSGGVIDLDGIGLTRGPNPDPHVCPECEARGGETTARGADARTFVCQCGHRWAVPFDSNEESP